MTNSYADELRGMSSAATRLGAPVEPYADMVLERNAVADRPFWADLRAQTQPALAGDVLAGRALASMLAILIAALVLSTSPVVV